MRIIKLDDYQSWMFEVGSQRIALDPWLTDVMRFPAGAWMFERRRVDAPAYTPATLPPLDALIISAHFGDHLHAETLAGVNKSIPVYTTSQAAPMLSKLGFHSVTVLTHGMKVQLGDQGQLQAVAPGAPYGSNALGFVLEESCTGSRLYFEAHVTDEVILEQLPKPITAMMTPVESVRLFGVQFSMDAERALRSVARVRPKFFFPTGIEPSRATGLFGRVLVRCRGTVDDFATRLAASGLATELVHPVAGEDKTG